MIIGVSELQKKISIFKNLSETIHIVDKKSKEILATVLPKSQIQKESISESLGGIFQNYKAEKNYDNFQEMNFGEYCRYSLHFMYAGKNYVKNNTYQFNSVGIFFMYSKDTVARGNIVKSSLGATGMGINLF